MKNYENLPEEIEILAKTKDYGELTKSEKSLVDKFFTLGEYTSFRQLYTSFAASESDILKSPPEKIGKAVLLQAEKDSLPKKAKVLSLSGIVKFMIPAWQAAAAVCILAFLFIFTGGGKTETRVIAYKDTVYVDREIIREVPVVVEKIIEKPVYISEIASRPAKEISTPTLDETVRKMQMAVGSSTGFTLSEDSSAKRFLTTSF